MVRSLTILLGLIWVSGYSQQKSLSINEFELTNLLIPFDEIRKGGPPKDGIPSIDKPKFLEAKDAFLKPGDLVVGVRSDGESKAYPIKILNWHEIVNDEIENMSIAVTYCPLCGSAVVFKSEEYGDFGVSGLLYNSDVLMYDRRTSSLWSQLGSKCISGPNSGNLLPTYPNRLTTWEKWSSEYPQTLVLSEETGFTRDYGRDPYFGYREFDKIFFPVSNKNPALGNKEIVLGITINGKHKAYPISRLPEKEGFLKDTFEGQAIIVEYSKITQTAWVKSPEHMNATLLYWFAWVAFHPETEIFDM